MTKYQNTAIANPLKDVFVFNVAKYCDNIVELFLEFRFRQSPAGFPQQAVTVLCQLHTFTTPTSVTRQ